MTERCDVIIGTLVAHPCAQRAGGRCDRCNKRMCPRHMSKSTVGTCVECTQEQLKVAAPVSVSMEELYHFTDGEIDAFDENAPPSLHDYDS